MKDQVFGVLQRIGRSFMLPIALLPAAGLLLGIGGSFSNVTMLEAYGLTRIMGPGTFWNALFMVMSRAGDIVFTNLPILFAMGVAIGMAKKEKEVAALAAVISFLVMHAAIGAMIEVNGGADSLKEGAGAMVAGIRSLQMGVFGGILVGLGTAWLHNRYYKIELPQVLSFFGGTRFVPIVCALFYVLVGILCEAILWKEGSCQKPKRLTAAWTAASLLYNGVNLLPIWFFWDTYYDFALASGMEQSYIDSYVRYYTSPGWLAFILLFTTLMGFLGCMVGSRLIRRHFQKAGVL